MLQESEAKYRDLFETVQEVFDIDRFIYDEQGNVIDWIFEDLTPAGFEFLGLKDIDDTKGKRGSEVLGREIASFYLPMIENARRSSKGVTFQYHSPYVDKEFLTSYIVRGDRLISAQMDITEQKKAEESIRLSNIYNRSLIEASLDPLITIWHDGKIADVNEATEHVTDYSRDELIGTDFSNYFTEPEKAKKGYQKVFKEGFVSDYALEIQHINGKITSVLYNASVYMDESGEVIGVFAAAGILLSLKKQTR